MAELDSRSSIFSRSEGDGKVRAPRLGEVVANRLRVLIVDGKVGDGSDIPPERELLEEFGVSRPTLREALRILETEGLISVRRGAQGGAMAHRPSIEVAGHYMGLLMQSAQIDVNDLADTRQLLESTCASLTAAQPEHSAIADRLGQLIEASKSEIDNPVAFTKAANRFHEELVASCGNQTLILIVGILERIWQLQEERWARNAIQSGAYPDLDARKEVLAAHERIQDAIREGDAARAERITERHLDASHAVVIGDAPPAFRAVRVTESS